MLAKSTGDAETLRVITGVGALEYAPECALVPGGATGREIARNQLRIVSIYFNAC